MFVGDVLPSSAAISIKKQATEFVFIVAGAIACFSNFDPIMHVLKNDSIELLGETSYQLPRPTIWVSMLRRYNYRLSAFRKTLRFTSSVSGHDV